MFEAWPHLKTCSAFADFALWARPTEATTELVSCELASSVYGPHTVDLLVLSAFIRRHDDSTYEASTHTCKVARGHLAPVA